MGLPDWLKSLRQPDQKEDASQPASDETTPDWLSGLRGEGFAPIEEKADDTDQDEWTFDTPSTSKRVEEESSSWLDNMRFGLESAEASSDAHNSESGADDWLSRLSAVEPDQPVQSQPIPDKEEELELPDWLTQNGIQPTPGDFEAAEETTNSDQDFLSNLLAQSSEKAAPEQPTLASAEPDWQAGNNALDDWLSQPPEQIMPDLTAPAAASASEEPDWLAGLGAQDNWLAQSPEQAAPAAAPEAEPESAESDWLSVIRTPDDWLTQPPPQATAPVASESDTLPDVPDWLADLAGPASASSVEEDLPEWIKESQPGVSFIDELGGESSPDWLAGADQPIETGKDDFGSPGLAAIVGSSVGKAVVPEEAVPGGDLDWLDELEAAYAASTSLDLTPAAGSYSGVGLDQTGESQGAVLGEALPGWLDEVSTQAPPQPEQLQPDSDIAPASLPSWLEAMRPVAAVGLAADLAQADAGPAEGSGPLQGVRGVIPAEPDVYHVRKPPAYSVKLQISDNQSSHADLLAQLIAAEAESRPVPGKPIISPQHVVRSAFFLVLVLAILLPQVLGFPKVAPPPYLPQVSTLSQQVGSLPANAPVLMAVDYEPAYSAELDATAASILDHLMIKGAYLTIVSTLPSGPAQAEHLIGIANQAGNHLYRPGNQYTNLGFIPGGASGLQSFAQAPRQTMPRDVQGEEAWGIAGLQNVNALADYSMVLVITENPETARTWIEQVQPYLGDASLVMVASAQAEPVIYPYYLSGQLQGLLSGIAQAAYYEYSIGRTGWASRNWTPYSLGMLSAIILILVGGGSLSAITMLHRNRKHKAPASEGR
jgi:hypothetical protein